MNSVEPFATALLQAHAAGLPSVAAGAGGPRNIAEAYEVQQRVLDALRFGRRPTAWKVSPPAADGRMQASPVAPEVLRSPARIEAGTRAILGIEAELCFRFAATPPDTATAADVRAAVDEILVLIELCETRLAQGRDAPALWKLADFQSHGAFVIGSGTRRLDLDFAAQRVELQVDGRSAVVATGSHPTGRLWEMLTWAAADCAARGMPLQAGDVVTTGTWTGLTPLAPGQEAHARFDGVGEARLTLLD